MPGPNTSDLPSLAHYLLTTGPFKTNPTPRRVRILHNTTYIADTISALHVWEHAGYPQFYIPWSAFNGSGLPTSAASNSKADSQSHAKVHWEKAKDLEGGKASLWTVTITTAEGNTKGTDRVLAFGDAAGDLAGHVRVEFGSVDAWFEEDTPIYVHPKDPFKRVDLLPSTRHIRVTVPGPQGDITLADTTSSIHLLETMLPTRYYLPPTTANQALLRPAKSGLVTKCPYKGEAEYYDVVLPHGEVLENLVWYYVRPTMESAAVAGTVCFYNEKVDIWIDGVKQQRAKTHFG